MLEDKSSISREKNIKGERGFGNLKVGDLGWGALGGLGLRMIKILNGTHSFNDPFVSSLFRWVGLVSWSLKKMS